MLMTDLYRNCASSVFFRRGVNILLKGIFYIFITFSLLAPGVLLEAVAEEKADGTIHSGEWWFEQKMNLECNGRTIEEVLKEVSAFFKTKIIYQAKVAKVPIHCSYSNLTAEQILSRLFKDQNKAIQLELAPERMIIVQIFGESKYNIVSSDGSTKTEILPFLADMTNEDLARMQKEQYRLYKKELANTEAIIPEVGLTRQELAILHQNQIQQYEILKNDPNQIIEGTNLTRQQLQEIHKKQLELYEQSKNDQNETDPFTGLTRSELKKLHKQQIKRSNDSAGRVMGKNSDPGSMSE